MITHVRHRKAVALAATFLCEANLILSFFDESFYFINRIYLTVSF